MSYDNATINKDKEGEMQSVKDVASVFLKLSEPDEGDTLTNLKLQKLVYYAQGFHLAIFSKPLFKEDILRWEHGPVVRELYDTYKGCGSSPLPIPEDFDPSNVFTKEQLDLLKEIHEVYGQFSAWKLRDMTHTEAPWKETEADGVIQHELLKKFFLTRIE